MTGILNAKSSTTGEKVGFQTSLVGRVMVVLEVHMIVWNPFQDAANGFGKSMVHG